MTSVRWMEDLFRAVTLGLMVVCIGVSLVALAEMFYPDWDGTYLVVFCGLVAVEAYYSSRLYRADLLYKYGWIRFRLLELALIFIALQLCVDAINGSAPFQDGVPQLDPKTVWLFVPVYCAWLLATTTARELGQLGKPASHEPPGMPPVPVRLGRRFFLGGLLLFVAAGLTQPKVAEMLRLPSPSSAGPVLNVLLYFLLGMLMLGHVRYAALRRRWREREITVAAELGSRWARYILLLVALMVILALVLPTSYTMSLLDLGRAARDALTGVLTALVTLIGRPLAQLLSLLGITPHPAHPRMTLPKLPPHLPRIRPQPPHHTSGHPISGNWGALLRSLFFWAVVLASALYLLRSYLQRHPQGARLAGKLAAVLRVLGQLWAALWRRLRRYAQSMAQRVPLGLALRVQEPLGASRLLRFTRLGTLSPREQVLHYYLSIVHHAGRRGFPRHPSQTPHEFSGALAPRLREAEGDMNLLTDAFVEARYSHHGVEEAQVGLIRTSWQHVRAALRRVKETR